MRVKVVTLHSRSTYKYVKWVSGCFYDGAELLMSTFLIICTVLCSFQTRTFQWIAPFRSSDESCIVGFVRSSWPASVAHICTSSSIPGSKAVGTWSLSVTAYVHIYCCLSEIWGPHCGESVGHGLLGCDCSCLVSFLVLFLKMEAIRSSEMLLATYGTQKITHLYLQSRLRNVQCLFLHSTYTSSRPGA
jgi:hypothetical protein